MKSSVRKMLLSCLVASSLIAMATAAGNEYLPPSKGYNYEPPSIPFPTNGNSNKIPTPGPGTYRPTPPPYKPTPPQQRPTYVPPPTGPHDHHHDEDHHHHHHEPGMPFDFSYAVNEDGNDYSHNAVSDGDVTRGEYRVALPDGRTQIVKYTADWKNGFNAEVSYEGEARYPEQPAAGGRGLYAAPSAGGGYQY